jgi:predicted PurR-regulated permease PerM
MFGLLAGGALFGFVGVLLALPVAAVIGVLARFVLARYLESRYYHHGAVAREPTPPPPTDEPGGAPPPPA